MASGHLIFLSKTHGTIRICNSDGSGLRTLISGYEGRTPDGVQVDLERGWVYWTVMGVPSENDGCIERCDWEDGANLTHVVLPGQTFTPKQLVLDKTNELLYWCDREGMRISRSTTSGDDLTLLLENGSTAQDRLDETRHCVGLAIDPVRHLLYWTQKGPSKGSLGKIFRAPLDLQGEDPRERKDAQVLFEGLPEPIDLCLDGEKQELYWTDRGLDSSGGNSLNRCSVCSELRPGEVPRNRNVKGGGYEIVQRHFHEAIGVAVDLRKGERKAYVADLGGSIYEMGLDGSGEKEVVKEMQEGEMGITGIEFVPV